MKPELTKQQKTFIQLLLDEELSGDPKLAAEMAGYSKADITTILSDLKDEIVEAARAKIAAHSVEAAHNLILGMRKPAEPGRETALKYLNSVLDRADVKPTDKIEVKGTGGLFVLPAKNED
jgi:hypothetical protein